MSFVDSSDGGGLDGQHMDGGDMARCLTFAMSGAV
jgi:hypothetical protein